MMNLNAPETTLLHAPARRGVERAAEPVPLVDLRLQHRRVRDEVNLRMAEVLDTAAFVLGPQVAQFEDEYASFCGVNHCIGVGNGTDAIELALRGAGIGAGDEVLIPANTFVATAEAVVRTGAELALVDCAEDFLMDPAQVAARVTERTRAVIVVDLFGQVARVEEIASAAGNDVLLIEDAAQSQGATRHGRVAGSFGTAAATSFYPGKNLGAYGDAGAVLTEDDEVAARVRALRNHGGQRRYEHRFIGANSRLDSLQAVVLSAKLAVLEAWNAERAAAAARYEQMLADVERVVLPEVVVGNQHVWHLYVVRVPERDRVLERLNAAGIGAGIHYPLPVHRLPAFRYLGLGEGSMPVSERFSEEILSLPIFPGITTEQQARVVHTLVEALR